METEASIANSGFSPDSISDPEEKEVSEEDDEDRNHKHRKRETCSQSYENDSAESGYATMHKKRAKSSENGLAVKKIEPQGTAAWRSSNLHDPENSSKFERRRHGLSRGQFDDNQRGRMNQLNHGEPGIGRGRGRGFRFNHLDGVTQVGQHGSISSNLFRGRGLQNVSNPRAVTWNAFGMVPGMPNTGLETIHSFCFQPNLPPTLNPAMNMSIPRPRCRDFEEQGFCLRGDMCPMEHGVNRIVVEDVQSLSQFNLPVPIPSGQLLATPVNPVALSSFTSHPSASISSMHGKSFKNSVHEAGLPMNGPDLYDPDEPLWHEEDPENANNLSVHPEKNDDAQQFVSSSDRLRARSIDDADNDIQTRSIEAPEGFQKTSSPLWGRIPNSKDRFSSKDGRNLALGTRVAENVSKVENSHEGNKIGSDSRPKLMDFSMAPSFKKHQKAQRTLFVNGIPTKSNRKELLLAHFMKFGQVIDIYIPGNSERAFVQFSKREEAEAALMSPDAVMGNRFIKLWWANRDNIADESTTTDNLSLGTSSSHSSSHATKTTQTSTTKNNTVSPSDSAFPHPDQPKPAFINGPNMQPPSQKKLQLEQLKEEFRKKQELLEQKRNDFRRQLTKLEMQASVSKHVDTVADNVLNKQKKIIVGEENEGPSASPQSNVSGDGSRPGNSLQPTKAVRVSARNVLPPGPKRTPISHNMYKLDNRPTSFKIISPLPSALKNVDALTEYFSSFGQLTSAEVEYTDDDSEKQKCGFARVTYAKRHFAEKAFQNGKSWKGHTLQFEWVTSRNNNQEERPFSISEPHALENLVSPKDSLDESISDEMIAKSIERDVLSLFESSEETATKGEL